MLSSTWMSGMVFTRQVEGDVTKATDCKVAVYSCPLDIMQTETKVTNYIKLFAPICLTYCDSWLYGSNWHNFRFSCPLHDSCSNFLPQMLVHLLKWQYFVQILLSKLVCCVRRIKTGKRFKIADCLLM